jgi:hypothetical protein
MKTDRVRWTVLSPDGVPIAPETYPSEEAARKALAAWCRRFEGQGYYAAVDGRIALADLPGRCRIESDETPDAKFARIADEIKTNADWRALLAGTHDDEMVALDEIAKKYAGEVWNTGGNIYVAVLPLGPHDALAVTGEVICHYHNAKATSMSEVFDEPDNDTSQGCVSLCD